MENKNNQDEMNLWHCCGINKGWKNCLLRWILGAVILIIVFCFGFKLGKYSTIFSERYSGMGENYYRNNMMYPVNYGNNSGYYYGPGMMQGYGQPQTIPTR